MKENTRLAKLSDDVDLKLATLILTVSLSTLFNQKFIDGVT